MHTFFGAVRRASPRPSSQGDNAERSFPNFCVGSRPLRAIVASRGTSAGIAGGGAAAGEVVSGVAALAVSVAKS